MVTAYYLSRLLDYLWQTGIITVLPAFVSM